MIQANVIVALLATSLLWPQFIFHIPQTGALLAAARQAGGSTATPNTYWNDTGVSGGIPFTMTKCGSTLATTTTSAQLNTAITSCNSGGGGYVELAAGTFTLSTGFIVKSNVVVRGQGMSTLLNINGGVGGSNWSWAGGACSIAMQGSGYTADAVPPIGSAASARNRDWTGTGGSSGVYTQGATVLNLSAAPTGLTVGDMAIVWQSDEPDANLPMNGFFFSDKNGFGTNVNVSQQGEYDDHDGAMEQRSRVTAINGTAVTISPGLVHATGMWQTALSPKFTYLTVSQTIHDAGIEDLRINSTGYTSIHECEIGIAFANNVWVTRVGLTPKVGTFHGSDSQDYGIVINDSMRVTISNNWIDPMRGGGISTTTSYSIVARESHHLRIENNIFNNPESPSEIHIGSLNQVWGYNYERYVGDASQEAGIQQHSAAASYVLVEGNTYRKLWADNFHGTTCCGTYFRNYFSGTGMALHSFHRWYNALGNAITGNTVYKSCVTDATDYARGASYAFRLGYASEGASSAADTGVPIDAIVCSSFYAWGNYAPVSGSVFSTSDVPTTDPVLPQPVPSTQVLPSSLYLSARPGYFTVNGVGTQPYPLNGPDITGGDFLSGHANKTPAQKLYDATTSNSVANFDPWRYGEPAGSLSFATNFPATENPISESSLWINGGTTGLDWSNCSTTGGFIRGQQIPDTGNPFNDSTCLLAGSWGNDQYAEATVVNNNTDPDVVIEVEIRLRSTVTAHSSTGYEVYWSAQSNDPYCTIARWNGAINDYVNIATTSTSVQIVTGDIVRATIVGTTIKAYINGVEKLSYDTSGDATKFSTGKPGIGFFILNNAGDPALQANYGFSKFHVVTH